MEYRNSKMKIKFLGLLAFFVGASLFFLGCPKGLDENTSAFLFYISSIEPLELASDVCSQSDPVLGCVAITDDIINVSVTGDIKAQFKTQFQGGAPSGSLNNIIMKRYRISFTKISGPPLTPDVPAPIEGAITATIEIPTTVTIDLVAVPNYIKNEEPLVSLRNSPFGPVKTVELRCLATVEIWGIDLSGNTVQTNASFTVRFSDASVQ